VNPRQKRYLCFKSSVRFGDEVRPEGEYFRDIEKKANPKTVEAIKKMIKPRLEKWSSELVTDPIQESLLKLVASKKKALKPVKKAKGKKAESDAPSNVINIMDALKKSVESDLKGRKKAG
jgi:DNA end-binding protein Ku